MRSTYIVKAAEIERKWWLIDAEGQTLGRLASEIASRLRGKHKPAFTPYMDNGDFVVVINAEKIHVTGLKLNQKTYRRHTGYLGGLKETTLRVMLQKKPAEALRHAVLGMLPKNTLGRHMGKKLKVYAGPEHKHEAQRPEPLKITN